MAAAFMAWAKQKTGQKGFKYQSVGGNHKNTALTFSSQLVSKFPNRQMEMFSYRRFSNPSFHNPNPRPIPRLVFPLVFKFLGLKWPIFADWN
jgi:hypothetical protein